MFECNSLIFVDSAHQGSHWVAPSKCVWKATFDCSVAVVLSTEYKFRSFFRDLLNIKDAGLDTIIDQIRFFVEAEHEAISNSVGVMQKHLLALDQLLRRSSPSDQQIALLKSLRCIPVWRDGDAYTQKVVKIVSSSDSFYIADRGTLFKAFQGLIWLPDFPDREEILGKLSNVIQHLDLRNRFLSVSVSELRVDIVGIAEYDKEATESLMLKIPLISR